MDRRGFLKRITAAAAAFTAAASGSGPALADRSPAAAKTLTPGVCVTADTSKFEKAVGDASRQVLELLRQCRVVDYSKTFSMHAPTEVRVIFEQADESAPRTDKDAEAWRLVESGDLKSLSVTAVARSVDICDLGGYSPIVIDDAKYEIEATWFVPAS